MREPQKKPNPLSNGYHTLVVVDNETPLLRPPETSSTEESLAWQEKLRRIAMVLCIISITVNLVLSLSGFIVATLRNSPATYAFAADCLLDLISSVIVIWRYYGNTYTMYSSAREQAACIGLGAFFILTAISITIEAIVNLVLHIYPTWHLYLLVMAGVGMGCCFLMAIAKAAVSRLMKSETLFLDAINSLLSGFFAFVIIISDVTHHYENSIWYLDPILSMFVSVMLVFYGIRVIKVHMTPPDLEP